MERVLRVLSIVILAVALGAPASARHVAANVDDPAFSQGLQWGLTRIRAEAAWSRGEGHGSTIAIVDSGADLRHEDLAAHIVESVTCIGSAGDTSQCRRGGQDDDGHGTHVAGIAAGVTGNGRGIAGVAPGASLLIVRVLEHECDIRNRCTATGAPSDIEAGIRWAADHGADVINLSVGTRTENVFGPNFASSIEYAWSKGSIPVLASGNEFVLSTISDDPVIVVTATDRNDAAASYANGIGNAQWGLSAPGGERGDTSATCTSNGRPIGVISTFWVAGRTNQYACLAGTSMAAPHVSGALAVLRGAGMSPRQAVQRLLSTADDLGPDGNDSTYGHGRINLERAVASLPVTTTSTTGTPASSSSTVVAQSTSTTPGGLTSSTTTGQVADPSVSTSLPPTLPENALGGASGDGGVRIDDGDGDVAAPLALLATLLALASAAATASVGLRTYRRASP